MQFELNTYGSIGWIIAAILFVGLAVFALRYAKLKKQGQVYRRDNVTGAASIADFHLRAEKIIANNPDAYAVVSMQVANLPQLIRTYGAQKGRDVLKYVNSILEQQLSGEEPAARTGEDSFFFLLKNYKQEDICIRLNRISAAANADNKQNIAPLQLLFGICLSERCDNGIDMFLDRAITARRMMPVDTRYQFFETIDHQKAEKDRILADSMDSAISTGEFVVYYQPKIRVSDQKIVGAEALCRWRHPQLGLLSPDMFLPIAEQYQKIGSIDRFVFRQVCLTLARWKKHNKELCRISINLAGPDMDNTGFADECYEVCCHYDVEPTWIEFEMKEGLLLENPPRAASLINRLHALGFHCAVDNFGSEHTALQLLSRLDIDTIKLDSSFFSGNQDSRRGRYIVEALLKLATQLHIQTVAKEIDSPGQLQFLRQAACDMIQGFCFFKPMPVERFEKEAYIDNALRYAQCNLTTSKEEESNKLSSVGQSVQSTKSIILFSWQPQEDTIEFSDSFSPILGNRLKFENARALFRTTELIHENDRDDFFRLLERCQREEGWLENTLRFYVGEGQYGWLELRMRQDHRVSGGSINGTMVNLAEWKKEVERWKEKATRDALTGLYNREYFEHSVISQLNQKLFDSGAILFIDVDDFKWVNDTLGHRFGDDVLCYVAKQILGVFRHTDIIARYGGDEFVVFAPYIRREVLEERLKKLCGAFQYPYRNDTVEYKVSCSIGAAIYPQNGSDYKTILQNADLALYEAKKRGKDQFAVFDASMAQQETDDAPSA